jgi:hypothetical protein
MSLFKNEYDFTNKKSPQIGRDSFCMIKGEGVGFSPPVLFSNKWQVILILNFIFLNKATDQNGKQH